MKTWLELQNRLAHYKGAAAIYDERGYIAWQMSTGENVELLFIEAANPRQGHGRDLLADMLKRIKPFNSVFVFRLASNEEAGYFYRSLGFQEQLVYGLYKVDAVLGVANYEDLCRCLSIR